MWKTCFPTPSDTHTDHTGGHTRWDLLWVSCVIIKAKQHRRFYFAVNLWRHQSTEATANVRETYPEKYWCSKENTLLTKWVSGAAIKSGMDSRKISTRLGKTLKVELCSKSVWEADLVRNWRRAKQAGSYDSIIQAFIGPASVRPW